MSLYDYIYVDRDKVISLYSQLIGGVVDIREISKELTRSQDNKRHYDFKVFKHDAGGTHQDTAGVKETITPHHSVLVALEEELAANGYIIDMTDGNAGSLRHPGFRNDLKATLCLKVSGRVVIEDYERIKGIASIFPDIVKLINKSNEEALLKNPEVAELRKQIAEAEKEIKSIKDRNERAREQAKVKRWKDSVDLILANVQGIDAAQQWVLDGLKTWIDAFLPGIVNLRLYPDGDRPDEHVFGHLKKSCFEDADTNSFHFTYGSFPTEALTLVGIITSVPAEDGEAFKPLEEFEGRELADYESIERVFRGLFRGFDGLEGIVRTCRFPRVLVYPLTVYRSVQPVHK